ncbi:MAG: hypothetical protein HY748_09730 [Elusimicrobia bacterium]|nr:hypothetical protein [Elusimicrobiota bacterium]
MGPGRPETEVLDSTSVLVESVNGISIGDMRDLVRAFQTPAGGFHVIRMDPESGYAAKVVLDAEAAAKAHPAILARHGIPSDRSEDLR